MVFWHFGDQIRLFLTIRFGLKCVPRLRPSAWLCTTSSVNVSCFPRLLPTFWHNGGITDKRRTRNHAPCGVRGNSPDAGCRGGASPGGPAARATSAAAGTALAYGTPFPHPHAAGCRHPPKPALIRRARPPLAASARPHSTSPASG